MLYYIILYYIILYYIILYYIILYYIILYYIILYYIILMVTRFGYNGNHQAIFKKLKRLIEFCLGFLFLCLRY